MKKIVASVGLVALGAAGLNTVHGQDAATTATPPPKPWSVSASLRGFYDDNINTAPNGPFKQSSIGYQISPGLSLNWQNEETSVILGYIYTLRWYDKQPLGNTSHFDQDHNFNAEVDHSFNERFRGAVKDSFVLGQEPDTLRPGYAIEEPQRVPGDNIRNDGSINVDGQITPVFGIEAGYANVFVDYHNKGPATNSFAVPGDDIIPSLSGTLDRIENSFHLDGRFQVAPQTIGILGYQFTDASYSGNEIISEIVDSGGLTIPGTQQFSRNRDYRANYGYVGADHNFLPDLSGSVRVGIRDTDYYNSQNKENDVSPYAMATLRYNYTTESYAEAGFNYDRNATDLIAASSNGNLTLDEESAVIYGTVHHRIVANLTGTLLAQFQNSTFNGGAANSDSERYYLVGLDFEYQFNPFLSANAGYNYDKVDSDIQGRSYDRNRVYIGLTASY